MELNQNIINPYKISGSKKTIKYIWEQIRYTANSNSNVLIQGESGTGKELVAQTIHLNSPRRKKPIIVINTSAIPANLLESELFGYEAGAFTGAKKTKPGKFELADGGTVFLDEIGEMDFSLQAKLLRAIENKTIERLGGIHSINLNIKIIAATNKDLKKLVKEGRFRDDLFYRLNVFNINLSPLRERKEDIPILVNEFVEKYSNEEEKKIAGIKNEVYNVLYNYDWPGNVRELENVIEHAVIMCDDSYIDIKHLPKEIGCNGHDSDRTKYNFYVMVDDYKKRLIINTLEETNYNKAEAARKLGMNRTHLFNIIKKLKIEI